MQRHERSFTHEWIWSAIDALARQKGLTASALARLSGLDATAFNRSKRRTAEGRPRWPSTESIAKILEATNTTLDEFAAIELTAARASAAASEDDEFSRVPMVGQIRDAIVLGWEPEVSAASHRRFAVAVADSSLEPVYSIGNTLVVSEAALPRTGDRVLLKPAGMPVMPRLLVAATPTRIEVSAFGAVSEKLALRRRDVAWMARIVLARQ
jgi:phage repressor protein C with HTH and peptisase S24 domain